MLPDLFTSQSLVKIKICVIIPAIALERIEIIDDPTADTGYQDTRILLVSALTWSN